MTKKHDRIQTDIPKHRPVSRLPVPIGKLELYKAEINVEFGYEPKSNNFGQFYFRVAYSGFDCKYPDEINYDLGFTIPGNCTVNMSLSKEIEWRWPPVTDGMTSKGKFPGSLFRGYTEAEKNNGVISFKVKKDGGSPKKYYFYLNVEMKQAKGKEEWRPVSIDPWLENPRPAN